jgi:hypothetical protein
MKSADNLFDKHRVDSDTLQRFCDAGDHGMSDCAFLAHFGVDLHSFDL